MNRTTIALAAAALLLAPAGMALGLVYATPAPIAPQLAERIAADPSALVDAFVTVRPPVTGAHVAAAESTGVSVLRVYSQGLLYVAGEGDDVLRLAGMRDALLVSGNEKIEFHLNSATLATNARDVWDTRSTSTTPVTVGGDVVDGSGIGVAVVDSGVDATHEDLAPAMGKNLKHACSTPGVLLSGNCAGNAIVNAATRDPGRLVFDNTCDEESFVEVANGDTSSGHGTHVAGIVAGRGIASGGRHVGAAPGATLYGLGVGDGDNILFAVDAFEWIVCHHDDVTPAIRVVTNSWGPVSPTGAEIPFDPNSPISVMTNTLIDAGVVVVFSASNEGGDGSVNVVNSYGKNPKPGVITVANYEDEDTGTRGGSISSSSSRGRASETPGEQWPDVAAPGMAIMSTRAKTAAVVDALGHPLSGGGRFLCCDNSQMESMADYVSISGTSMAAPHVAGVVALLLQANPALTPAQVENILEDTATQVSSAGAYVADPTNPGSTTNHITGHGLVDALAAVQDARVGTTSGAGSPQPAVTGNAAVFVGGLVNPQALAHARWVVPAGPVGFAELTLASSETSVADGTAVRFVVDGGAPIETTIVAGRADVDTTLASGQHVVEVHIETAGGAWRAFDSFRVDAA